MNEALEIEVSKNGNALYIFFGGIVAGIGMPPFEFYKSSQIMDQHKIFVRDFSQCWYQDGLPSIGHDIYSIANHLRAHIARIQPEKIFFVGNSMGGYAAILFSEIIDIGEAIAFAPQTFICPSLRLEIGDDRWKEQIEITHKKSLSKRHVWDLRPFLLKSGKHTKISIFVSKEDKLDSFHAAHIADIPSVRIFRFEGGGHKIVRLLRENGQLPEIMMGSYGERHPPQTR